MLMQDRLASFSVAALLLLAAGGVVAEGEEPHPFCPKVSQDSPSIVDWHEQHGSGWVFYRLKVDQEHFSLLYHIEMSTDADRAYVLWDEDLQLVRHAWPMTAGHPWGVHAQVGMADLGPVEHYGSGVGYGCGGGTFRQGEGTYYLLFMAAGVVEDWRLSLHAAEGERLAKKEGDSAFWYAARDFEGDLVFHASAMSGGYVVKNGSLEHEIEDLMVASYRPVGDFAPIGAGSKEMSAVTPSGETTCPCNWSALEGETAGPGLYRFLLDGADFGGGFSERDVIVMGADVQVPE